MFRISTETELTKMQATVAQRSQSFVEFAYRAAVAIGDTAAAEIYRNEIERRRTAEQLRSLWMLDHVITGGEDL